VRKPEDVSERDLNVPSEVERDAKAREVLRAWVANGGLTCSLRPDTWGDPSAWGIVLADVARHVANAVRDLNGEEPTATTAKILAVFNAELSEPTGEPSGRFQD
jgi:hypothetical protein